MNTKKNKKSTYTFFGVAILTILILTLGWFYLTTQTTKVTLSSDKTAYFPDDQIKVDVSIINYKNANEASVAVHYPDNATLVDTITADGVTTKSLDSSVIFEADETFFEDSETKLGTLVFDIKEGGELEFTLDKDLTTLNSSEGNIEIKEFADLTVSAGIPSDDGDVKAQESTRSAFEL